MVMPLTKMTPKLQKCGNYYLKGMSMMKAMIAAGYSEAYAKSNCSRILHNRALQEYIRKRQQDEADAELADATFIKKRLMELAESPDPQISALAIKQLDHHHEWREELAAKIAAIEAAKQAAPQAASQAAPVTININEVKKD